jgi:O-antigen biosynthesis protein WbqP
MYVAWGKRLLDVCVSLLMIVLLSPLLIVTAIAIWLEDRQPALFRQQRIGRDESRFTLLKFRSMPVATPNIESRHATALQVTRVGAFIRRTSIDELPQLFNVLAGSMSLVGPRPPLPSQQRVVELRRASGVAPLKPGVTGLAQINACDGFTDEQKVALDSKYASSIGLMTDIRIMLGTVGYLFRKPPVY